MNNRGQRLAREAKAIQRKANRNNGKLSGREVARLTKVQGRIVKYQFDDSQEDDSYDEYQSEY
jgi:hypothetical protein